MSTEADTCRKFVLPKLYDAGWTDDHINEQLTFTDGRIVVAGSKVRRRPQKRADYLLRHTRDLMLAVVEAKAAYKKPGDGLQQAKEYAQVLGLKFAYATNGHGIVEHDFLTGKDRDLDAFPSPQDLWARLAGTEGISSKGIADKLLTPYYHLSGKTPRYYQESRKGDRKSELTGLGVAEDDKRQHRTHPRRTLDGEANQGRGGASGNARVGAMIHGVARGETDDLPGWLPPPP
jgi:type I site-specific restriction endonuclease